MFAAAGRYIARFPTRTKFCVVRLPFAMFRPELEGQAPLDPASMRRVAVRYELRRSGPTAAAALQQQQQQQRASAAIRSPPSAQQSGRFKLEVDWIKALPGE